MTMDDHVGGRDSTRIALPATLRALVDGGHLDYWGGRPYADFTDAEREDRYERSKLHVLWWMEIEWDRDAHDIARRRERDDEMLRPGLFPFAGDNGALYCLYPPWAEGAEGAEVPVVFARRDVRTSHQFARDIDECLVRCLLVTAADEDGWSPEDWLPCLLAHRAILRRLVRPEMVDVLDALGETPTRAGCEAALEHLIAAIPERALDAIMEPVRYDEAAIARYGGAPAVVRAYQSSERFYLDLVENEGRTEYADRLRTVRERLRELGG